MSTDATTSPLDPAASGAAEQEQPLWLGLSALSWFKIISIAGLMVWLFYIPSLRRLWYKTAPFIGEPNWGHSVVVPIVGLYYLYLNREELFQARIKPLLGGDFSAMRFITSGTVLAVFAIVYLLLPYLAPLSVLSYARAASQGMMLLGALALLLDWGLGSLLFGLAVFGYGIYPGQNDWLKDVGMVLTLFGVVLTLCGWQVMKIAWFPILFLICALPWPGLVYSKIAGPLQQLAAAVAVETLNICGVEASRSGTKIFMGNGFTTPTRTLNVAEACAGLRSLMTFISIGAAVAFLSARPLWQKIIITASAVPIAIFCNVMRVAGQGLLDHYVSQKLSESFAHQFVGMVMLLPALFLILMVGWLLDQIFIEEVDEPKQLKIKVTPRRGIDAAGAEGGK